mmetsp:Transcript_18950/g.39059  ORF Transcript_18950/g.39059 Transcript_18950/m.39059 type:complete len:471 (-) Transcript_18950:214-1626(-)|eukprot:CAMPEP_0171725114 /NCGR_PEP_ID=MMETSP0991-20121206/24784_1 /TAXON_ID=483369 /ORGANISM="non described non described, Strain CCMP2098" /LENGTH=470 /DNA_ID=CAMNT_0012318157 /DNA_START=22 /DNA_END=1434 /DNA_ORIENTATION=-
MNQKGMRHVCTTTLIVLALFVARADGTSPSFWPNPTEVSSGSVNLNISSAFSFELTGVAASSAILTRGAVRYENLILQGTAQNDDKSTTKTLSSCTVEIFSTGNPQNEAATLVIGMDESYIIDVVADPSSCTITAATVWGALHAFETFSQSLQRHQQAAEAVVSFPETASGEIQIHPSIEKARVEDTFVVVLPWAPLRVSDAPRFTHRGLLVDTSRHYLPLEHLQHVVESLAASKFNVLHWHTVDAQSFPLAPASSGTAALAKGAYSPSLTYPMQSVAALAAFAADRGVRLVIEVDVPGHAASWGAGFPALLADCLGKYSYNANDFALDPTNEGTYQVLDTLVGDLSNAVAAAYTADLATTADTTAPARATTAATAVDSATTAAPAPPPFALHLGGDEVVYGCWANDSSIVGWMEVNGFASGDYDALLGYFVAKAQAIAKNRGELRPTHWEEVFKAGLASTVVPETIFQV